MAIRRVWVPVSVLALVEVETDNTDKREIFMDAVDKAYESNLVSLPKDDYMLDDAEIDNALDDQIEDWVED